MGRIGGWLLVAGVAAVALAAAVHGFLGDPGIHELAGERRERPPASEGPQRLVGPDAPLAGSLDGTILLAGLDGCRLAALDLATLTLGSMPLATTCSAWVSPDGRHAVLGRPASGFANGPRAWLARLGNSPGLVRELGIARGAVSWSPDGRRVAWCGEERTTTVLTPATGHTESYPGCGPVLTPTGDLLTLVDDPGEVAVLLNGRVLLDEAALRSGFARSLDGRPHPLGIDQRADGTVAVAVAAAPFEPTTAGRPEELVQPGPFGALAISAGGSLPLVQLQLWRAASLERTIALPPVAYRDSQARFGDTVAFSPDGNEVAVAAARARTQLVVLDVRSGRAVLPPTTQLGFSWSPDGAWLALSGDDEIGIYGAARDAPVFRLPVVAVTLAWR